MASIFPPPAIPVRPAILIIDDWTDELERDIPRAKAQRRASAAMVATHAALLNLRTAVGPAVDHG